jgi:hypothetical protein
MGKIAAKSVPCHLNEVQRQMCYETWHISLEQFHCHGD